MQGKTADGAADSSLLYHQWHWLETDGNRRMSLDLQKICKKSLKQHQGRSPVVQPLEFSWNRDRESPDEKSWQNKNQYPVFSGY